LRGSDGEVKTAIVVARAGIAPAVARERLAAHGGIVRAVLEGARHDRRGTTSY